MILKDKDALYLKSELKEDLFMCPKCREKVSMKSLVSEDGVMCPECSRVATITIIDDTGFVSWTCGIEEGRIKISEMPELPSELRDRLKDEYSLDEEEARKLSSVKERASLFEQIVRDGLDPKLVSTFVVDTLVGELKYRDMKIDGFKSDGVVDILKDYTDDKITWDILEDILRKSLDDDDSVSKIYADYDHSTIEEDDLYDICREVIREEKSAVEDYKEGDDSAINYLIGKVKKKTDGSADAKETRKILKEIIQK